MNLYKDVSSRTSWIVILAGIVFFLALFFYFDLGNKIQSDSASFVASTTVPDKKNFAPGLPIRLKIPKITVDAAIDPIGTTPSGLMDVPSEPGNTGWYKSGPRPGDVGSAVIDGHYGRWKNGERSVFDDLSNLEEGDVVYVEDEKGVTTSFTVRERRSYDPNADALDVFESSDGKSHLNLITCEGNWDKVSKSFSERLVVFTDKE